MNCFTYITTLGRNGALASNWHWLRIALFSFALVASAITLRAEGSAASFEAANKLYDEGKYAEAAAEYNKLIGAGSVSDTLYFNRGNALFKLGQIGSAIASYRQAQLLAPRDRDIRVNLQYARTRARGGSTYRAERWRNVLSHLSVNEWTILTAAALWLLFIQLAVCQWQLDFKETLRKTIWASGLAAVGFGVCLGITFEHDYQTPSAIVTVGEAEVRNGPLDEAPSVFKVRDGAELEVVDQKDNWFQVIDSADRIGWLRQDAVMMFTPAGASKTKS